MGTPTQAPIYDLAVAVAATINGSGILPGGVVAEVRMTRLRKLTEVDGLKIGVVPGADVDDRVGPGTSRQDNHIDICFQQQVGGLTTAEDAGPGLLLLVDRVKSLFRDVNEDGPLPVGDDGLEALWLRTENSPAYSQEELLRGCFFACPTLVFRMMR